MNRLSYVVIANATAARIYCRDGEDKPLRLVREFQRPEPSPDARRMEQLRFAHELCVFLEHEAQRGAFESLSLFAPGSFLGDLNSALGPACKNRLSFDSDADFSHIGPAELGKRVEQALCPAR